MRSLLAALALTLLPLSVQAMDEARLLLVADAPDAIGSAVHTADQVKLGHLVAFREQADGSLFSIVQLDQALRVDTSALMVSGLMLADDGSLHLNEDAATLAALMKLPLLAH